MVPALETSMIVAVHALNSSVPHQDICYNRSHAVPTHRACSYSGGMLRVHPRGHPEGSRGLWGLYLACMGQSGTRQVGPLDVRLLVEGQQLRTRVHLIYPNQGGYLASQEARGLEVTPGNWIRSGMSHSRRQRVAQCHRCFVVAPKSFNEPPVAHASPAYPRVRSSRHGNWCEPCAGIERPYRCHPARSPCAIMTIAMGPTIVLPLAPGPLK